MLRQDSSSSSRLRIVPFGKRTNFFIQNIVDTSLVHEFLKEQMTEYLSAVAFFLKYGYSKYVTKTTDNCIVHDLNYILGWKLDFDKPVSTISSSL